MFKFLNSYLFLLYHKKVICFKFIFQNYNNSLDRCIRSFKNMHKGLFFYLE